jgi:succinyl-CoA:acetate CoA-transferase
MTDKPKQEPIRSRVQGDVPIVDAKTAAAKVSDDATVLTSGFGSVG